MLRTLPLLLLLAACGSNPDKPASPGESRLTAKAIADVDAAMADARRPPPAAAPAQLAAAPAAKTP